jgi:hypothetical protein
MPADEKPTTKYPIELPYGVFEYTAFFLEPALDAWTNTASIIRQMLRVLEIYGFNFDNVEVKNRSEKPAEYEISFKSASPNIAFHLSVAKLTITCENLSWGDKDKAMEILNAGIKAVLELTKAEIRSQRAHLAMHIQLKTAKPDTVTERLLSPIAHSLMDGALEMSGIILLRKGTRVIIDASAAFANGLFVRLQREHAKEVALEQIAEMLYNDEKQLFDVLGLEGEL